MSGTEDDPEEEAIDWVLRLPAADAAAWQRFTLWLEFDPRNAAAYNRASMLGDEFTAAYSKPLAADALPIRRKPRSPWRVGSIAAALAAMIGGVLFIPRQQPDELVLATSIGTQRSVTLSDGSSLLLAGGTRMQVPRVGSRKARLLAGSVRVRVVHNLNSKFEIFLGNDSVVDIGTEFELTRTNGLNEIAVIAGAVQYNFGGERLRLGPGDRVADADGASRIERSRVDPASIAQWADGSLSFREAGLEDVARGLAHATGLPVTADPALAARRFTGRIVLSDSSVSALRQRVQAVLGVDVAATSEGWRLSPVGSEAR